MKLLEEKLGKVLKEKQIPSVLKTASGKAGEVGLQTIKEEKVNYVVIGSRCTGNVRRGVLGSTTDYLVNHSPVPVMVIRCILNFHIFQFLF